MPGSRATAATDAKGEVLESRLCDHSSFPGPEQQLCRTLDAEVQNFLRAPALQRSREAGASGHVSCSLGPESMNPRQLFALSSMQGFTHRHAAALRRCQPWQQL